MRKKYHINIGLLWKYNYSNKNADDLSYREIRNSTFT